MNMYLMRRRKGFFTIIFLISCFLYFNWLLNVSDWSYSTDLDADGGEKQLVEKVNQIYRKKKKLTYYEVFETYENIRVEKSNKDRFVLLTVDQRLSKPTNKEYDEDESNGRLSSNEVKNLLSLLSDNEVFLLDVDILKNLKFTESIVEPNLFAGYKYAVRNFFKLDDYFKDTKMGPSLFISFGILLQSFSNLNKVRLSTICFRIYKFININAFDYKKELISKLNSKCRYVQMSGNYFNEKVLTNLYIECKLLTLQISIVYDRGDFLWIGSDEYKNEERKYFGDTPRALNSIKLATIVDESGKKFNVPSNLKKFLFDYDHSRFLECNTQLAKKNIEKLGKKYAQNEKKNKMVTKVTEHLSDSLEGFYKHYWLAGGTLLGLLSYIKIYIFNASII